MRTLMLAVIIQLLTASVAFAASEARIALVIGNGRYERTSPLTNSVNDARLISAKLKASGFATTLLVDGNKAQMDRAVAQFSDAIRKSGDRTVALFFYAGHGVQVDQRNYLVPVDASLEDRGKARIENVSADTIVDMVTDANARMGIFFFDACRTDPYPATSRGLQRMGLAKDVGTKRPPGGVLIAYATAPGSVAIDGRGSNSPFTKALSETITVPGLMIEQVMKKVRVAVRAETQGEQESWDSSSLIGDFYFIEIHNNITILPENLGPQKGWWERIRNSTSVSDFDDFLKSFPDGPYAELALARRTALTASRVAGASGGPNAPITLTLMEGGAQVVATAKGSLFYGQLFAGDVIRAVDDDAVAGIRNVSDEMLRRIKENGRVALKVQRRNLTLMVTLRSR
jgi:hypothetical protein